ncbi:MAG: patatin-like phospholipase family protein [Patescibacteria group bacterium]
MNIFKKKKKKLGLALGSGGFRGSAHIGVIKTLIDNGIEIDYIAGSSIGSLIAAHYALFKDIKKTEEDFFKQQKRKYDYLRDFNFKTGLLSGRTIEKDFRKVLNNGQFSDVQTPLAIVATDLISGKPYIFRKGDLAEAIRASISIPLTFNSFKKDEKVFVDGGLSNPVPDDVVRSMGADVVVSVNLYNDYKYEDSKMDFFKVLSRSIEISLYNLSSSTLRDSDIVINPSSSKFSKEPRLKAYFNKDISIKIMKDAEVETKKRIKDIKKLINS